MGWAGFISQLLQYIYWQPLLGQHHLLSVVVSHTHLHFFLPWHIFKCPHHQAAFTCGRWMHWDTEPCACSYRHSTAPGCGSTTDMNTVLQPRYIWAAPLQLKSRNNWAEKEGIRLNGHGPTSLNFQASSGRFWVVMGEMTPVVPSSGDSVSQEFLPGV